MLTIPLSYSSLGFPCGYIRCMLIKSVSFSLASMSVSLARPQQGLLENLGVQREKVLFLRLHVSNDTEKNKAWKVDMACGEGGW